MDEIIDTGKLVGDEVDAPETVIVSFLLLLCKFLQGYSPSITVTCGKAHEAVGQVVLVDESAELASHMRSIAHRLVPVTNDSLCDQSSEVVIILPAHTLDSNRNVCGWDGIITDSDLRSDELRLSLLCSSHCRRGTSVRLSRKASEVFLRELNELLVGNTSSTNKNHTVGSIVRLNVVDQVVSLDALDVLSRAQNRAS